MKSFVALSVVVFLLMIGCAGGNHQSPIMPDTIEEGRGLALYTMTFNSRNFTTSGDREGQANHGEIDLVEQGNIPYLDGDNFNMEASLLDYDRKNHLLTIEFTATNVRSDYNPIFDPRLVFFFDYTDTNDGMYNCPNDPYQLLSPDLNQDEEPDTDLLMLNIDQNGDDTDVSSDPDGFAPAARLMTGDNFPYVLFWSNQKTIVVNIRIPSEADETFDNSGVIKWNILIEGTVDPEYVTPHSDAIDIIDQILPSYLVADDYSVPRTLSCTLKSHVSLLEEYVEDYWTVYAWLDDFDNFTGWVLMKLSGEVVGSQEREWVFTLDNIEGDGLIPENSPYPIRIKAEYYEGEWVIADDAYAHVVPNQGDPDDQREKSAGHYWVVYLEEHPDSGRYEFKATNTVTGRDFWLSGPDNYLVDDDILENYNNFRHLSMARLGEYIPGQGGDANRYRLVFEAEPLWYEPTAGDKPNIDILGLTMDFSDSDYVGEFSLIAYDYYIYNETTTYFSIEREPCISPDGYYVVYEKEERVRYLSADYDVTRCCVTSFDESDSSPAYPVPPIEVEMPDADNDTCKTSTEPTIGFSGDYGYFIGYATDVDPNSNWTAGLGCICLTGMIPDDLGFGDTDFVVGEPYQDDDVFNLHSPCLAPDASYISFCGARFGPPTAYGFTTDPSTTSLDTGGPFEGGPALYQYDPSVSSFVDEVRIFDVMPNDDPYDEIQDWNHNRVTFRAGNDKNADIVLCFSSNTPGGLQDIQAITDSLAEDDWRDDRGHDNFMDMSDDGCAMVWASSRYSGSDIYFLDLTNLTELDDGPWPNQEVISKIIRITFTGNVVEPQISDFIQEGEL